MSKTLQQKLDNQGKKFFFTEYPNISTVYQQNVKALPSHITQIPPCLVGSTDVVYRFARPFQEILRAIVKALRKFHNSNLVCGHVADLGNIYFLNDDDSTKVHFHYIDDSGIPGDDWRRDYQDLKRLILHIMDHFNIPTEGEPDEIKHLFSLLDAPEGKTMEVENHFSLWDAIQRAHFFKTLDKFLNNKDFVDEVNYEFRMQFPLDFNFHLYVFRNSYICERLWTSSKGKGKKATKPNFAKDVIGMCKIFGDSYENGDVDAMGRQWSLSVVDKCLHTAFPFALGALGCALSNMGSISLFWGPTLQ